MDENLISLKKLIIEAVDAFISYNDKEEEDKRQRWSILNDKLDKVIESNEKIIATNKDIIEKICSLNTTMDNCDKVAQYSNKVADNSNEVPQYSNETLLNERPSNNLSAKDDYEVGEDVNLQKEDSAIEPKIEENAEEEVFIDQEDEKSLDRSEDLFTQEQKKEDIKEISALDFLKTKVMNSSAQNPKQDSNVRGELFSQSEGQSTVKGQGEKFVDNKQKSIFEQFENKNKSDLRTAIGVSEKFLFINDLFAGNMREYTQFILSLNDKDTLEKSMEIVNGMQAKKKWAKNSLAYTTLEALLKKRFEK